jgi:hypothetical protein
VDRTVPPAIAESPLKSKIMCHAVLRSTDSLRILSAWHLCGAVSFIAPSGCEIFECGWLRWGRRRIEMCASRRYSGSGVVEWLGSRKGCRRPAVGVARSAVGGLGSKLGSWRLTSPTIIPCIPVGCRHQVVARQKSLPTPPSSPHYMPFSLRRSGSQSCNSNLRTRLHTLCLKSAWIPGSTSVHPRFQPFFPLHRLVQVSRFVDSRLQESGSRRRESTNILGCSTSSYSPVPHASGKLLSRCIPLEAYRFRVFV